MASLSALYSIHISFVIVISEGETSGGKVCPSHWCTGTVCDEEPPAPLGQEEGESQG